jgi:hypothetical protein
MGLPFHVADRARSGCLSITRADGPPSAVLERSLCSPPLLSRGSSDEPRLNLDEPRSAEVHPPPLKGAMKMNLKPPDEPHRK